MEFVRLFSQEHPLLAIWTLALVLWLVGSLVAEAVKALMEDEE